MGSVTNYTVDKKHHPGWPLSSSDQIPSLLQVFLTEALIFIKPPEVYRQAYVYFWVNIVALLAVHLGQVNIN